MPSDPSTERRPAGSGPAPGERGGHWRHLVQQGGWLRLIWILIVCGLLVRLLRAPSLPGTYPQELDGLLYTGQRLLHGQWLYQDLVTGSPPLAQILFAPSAWIGSIQAHRLLMLALNLLAGGLLWRGLRRCGPLGLIPLPAGSLLPWLGGALFITLSQIFPEGSSGPLQSFVNLFLIAAFERSTACVAGWRSGQPLPAPLQLRSGLWLQLALIGLLLALACGSRVQVSPPLLLVLALLLVRLRQRLHLIVPLLMGAALGLTLPLLPYLLLADGPAHAWAGAVLLPIAASSHPPPPETPLIAPLARWLATQLAGLPLWVLLPIPLMGLGRLLRSRNGRAARTEPDGAAADSGRAALSALLLPGLAAVFCMELLFTLQRMDGDSRDPLLTIPPLVLLLISGLAALEWPAQRWSRWLARLMLVGLSLIYLNNIVVVAVSQPPRLNREVRLIEADRDRVRRHLQTLSARERSFSAPQDVALQRQLGAPSATVGIGPSWSLNQRQLRASAATRSLGLPTDAEAACRQLTARPTRQLVWMRTDPDGPNSLEFLQHCLRQSGDDWRDRSDALGLTSGRYRLFSRLAQESERQRPPASQDQSPGVASPHR